MNKSIFIISILLFSVSCNNSWKTRYLDSIIMEAPNCIYTHLISIGNLPALKTIYAGKSTIVLEFDFKSHQIISAEEVLYTFTDMGNLVSYQRNETSAIGDLLVGFQMDDADFDGEDMSSGSGDFRIELDKLWKLNCK